MTEISPAAEAEARLRARLGNGNGDTWSGRGRAVSVDADDVRLVLAELDQIRHENIVMNRLVAELMTGQVVTPDDAVEVVRRRLAATCVRCGRPLADQQARCVPGCVPVSGGGAR